MKNSTKITFLIESGLSLKTVSKMSKNQINLLFEKFKKETKEMITKQVLQPNKDSKDKETLQAIVQKSNPNMSVELEEDETNDVTSLNALGMDALQSYTGQEAPHDANDQACDGMDDDSCNARGEEGIAESRIDEKFESKAQQGLFWARCNKCSLKNCKWCKMAKEFSDSTSKKQYKNMPEKKHPEKTVEYKKKKNNEETQKYWENKILEMLEEEKKKKQSKKKESETMILRKPKKVSMFSDEAPMKLPIGKMFSIGRN